LQLSVLCALLLPPCPRFVEQEVERVKQLFERKESRLRSERDEAAQHADAAAAATAHLEAKVGWRQRIDEHQASCGDDNRQLLGSVLWDRQLCCD
jgi:hypothetical protein